MSNLKDKLPSIRISKAVLMGCKKHKKVTKGSSPAWRGAPCRACTM